MLTYKCKIKKGQIIPQDLNRFKNDLNRFENKFVQIRIEKIKKTRTSQQNRALHLWFVQVAEELNNAGWDMRKLISKEIDISWSPISVKEYLWRKVQIIYCGKKSTAQLTTEEINEIYDIINRTIGERTGIFVPFPSIDTLFEEYEKELGVRR